MLQRLQHVGNAFGGNGPNGRWCCARAWSGLPRASGQQRTAPLQMRQQPNASVEGLALPPGLKLGFLRQMSFDRLRHRLLTGRPLVVDSDTGAAFRARGVAIDTPGALGLLLRKRPADVLAHYEAEIASRVDVLSALTPDTTPRALAEVGMQHRSAMLTSLAVELAQEAAATSPKPIAVAGVLGSEMVSPLAADRLHEEFAEHAERLAVAGCELIIARGQGSRLGLMAAVVAAAATELPTWAVLECESNGDVAPESCGVPLLDSLQEAGASVVLFEVASIQSGLARLHNAAGMSQGLIPGVLLAASRSAVRGFDDPDANPWRWASGAIDLDTCGARVIGGGAGTTEAHTAALAQAMGALHPSIPQSRSDTEVDRSPPGT
jgi:methionine synthase I (cobalamin-dependent)